MPRAGDQFLDAFSEVKGKALAASRVHVCLIGASAKIQALRATELGRVTLRSLLTSGMR
jgi:hypothetical protein